MKAKGLEVELQGRWGSGIEGRLNYTFQQVRDGETDSTPVNSPKHVAKGNLIIPLLRDKLFAGIEIQYMSKRKTLADHSTDDICITNLTLFSQKLIKGLEISGTLYNLFNKKYGDPGSEEHVQDQIEQDGRTFRA